MTDRPVQPRLRYQEFTYAFKRARPKEMGGSHEHQVTAYGETNCGQWRLGDIRWHHKTGEILGLGTYEPFRRQGVATGMLGEARRIAGETRGVASPRHSAQRTDLGEQWARSLGERLPKRQG